MLEDGENPHLEKHNGAGPAEDPIAGTPKPLKLQIDNLVEDARALAIAEVEYYRTKLSINMAATKTVLALFAVAVTLGLTAVVTLVLGILLIVAEYLGPIAATGTVTGVVLLTAVLLMHLAIKRARKLPLDESKE